MKIRKRHIVGAFISVSGGALMLFLAPLGFGMTETMQALFVVSLSVASTSLVMLGMFVSEMC